jgi:4-hydroxybenzoate polyprenyltransferase
MRVQFFARHGTWFLAAGVAMYGAAAMMALTKGILILILLLVPLCIGLLYSFLGLKKIVIVKNLSVGISWGTTALLVGAFHHRFGLSAWSLFAFFTIECFIGSVISDVKDIQGDRLHRISTLPVILGLQRTKYVCYALNGIALAIAILSAVLRWIPWHGLAVCATTAYMLAFTYLCNEERGRLFFWACL